MKAIIRKVILIVVSLCFTTLGICLLVKGGLTNGLLFLILGALIAIADLPR